MIGFILNGSERRRAIGLLTGTFDPVHLGHVAMAKAAMKQCSLDEVWFLVNPEPLHKIGVAKAIDRVAMVRLALDLEPNIREGEQPAGTLVRHTMADFSLLMARHPSLRFVFIVGAEVLTQLSEWQDSSEVASSAKFAVARRPGHEVELRDGLSVQWFSLTSHTHASSGYVRDSLAKNIVPQDLDSHVATYINAHQLYGSHLSTVQDNGVDPAK